MRRKDGLVRQVKSTSFFTNPRVYKNPLRPLWKFMIPGIAPRRYDWVDLRYSQIGDPFTEQILLKILLCASHCFGPWGSAVNKLGAFLPCRSLHLFQWRRQKWTNEDHFKPGRVLCSRRWIEEWLTGWGEGLLYAWGLGRPLWWTDIWVDSWTMRMTQPYEELGRGGSDGLSCSRTRKETCIGLKRDTWWCQRGRQGPDHIKSCRTWWWLWILILRKTWSLRSIEVAESHNLHSEKHW